jgi:superfamily II DNA/RNA helicase
MSFFGNIYNQLKTRSTEATLSILGIRNPDLRSHLSSVLRESKGEELNILADPVFEAVFPWEEGESTFAQLSGDLLHQDLVNALDNPPRNLQDGGKNLDLSGQALKRNFKPYVHQIASWRKLKEDVPKSIVVTSGTGSGKTECFMVPILDDLVRQREIAGPLSGVQAILLYPLNALINSQRERLLAWTAPFGQDIRFCLYNSSLPEKPITKQNKDQKPPNEVHDRHDLRKSPPPILVTNPTMLEYMLIRNTDQPILTHRPNNTRLKYIVLDEAHTYIGSQAAELALLIRRALFSFGVSAADVRFIATSATIGESEEAKNNLKKYLSDLAGIPIGNVEVIGGSRLVSPIPAYTQQDISIDEIKSLTTGTEKFEKLCSAYKSLSVRRMLTASGKKALKVSELGNSLFPGFPGNEQREKILEWLDTCSEPDVRDAEGNPFLPVRGHFFHRTLNGLWSCVNSQCSGKTGTSLEKNWAFGRVFTQQQTQCPHCKAPVYELIFCNDCNTGHLRAELGDNKLIQRADQNLDDFRLEVEEDDSGTADGADSRPEGFVVISPVQSDVTRPQIINSDGQILGSNADGISILLSFDENICHNCTKTGQHSSVFRLAYLGMPFYSSNIVPTLLENTKEGAQSRPAHGRNLITFTDNRQGTAKMAIKLQLDAERNRLRGKVYQLVNAAARNSVSKINALQREINVLQKVRDDSEILKIIAGRQDEIDTLQKNALIPWNTAVQLLTAEPDFNQHIFDYYRFLTPGLFQENHKSNLSEFLLLREYARRPKRANSTESLGLVSLYYQDIDSITNFPDVLRHFELGLEDWKNYLKVCVDFHVRESTFIEVNPDWLAWFGAKIYPKKLMRPDSQDQQDSRNKRWPQYFRIGGVRQNRLIRILMAAFDYNPESITPVEEAILNELLRKAWLDLIQCGLLVSSNNDGRYSFNFNRASLKRVSMAWYCPITMRVIDNTFARISPYLPFTYNNTDIHCEQIELPVFPDNIQAADWLDGIRQIREWQKFVPELNSLRLRGIWTDQSDRISEGGFYYRSAEHSAQQDPKDLHRYESQFKEGRINVLNCSTTMEMGVDIGGLSIVHNNNVPPHPANYLQRAGRAGRRKETRALSTTICKANTHDLSVFRNPDWAFTKQAKEPNITLRSEPIVQRHINALLFGYYLNSHLGGGTDNGIRMKCNWFFKNDDAQLCFASRMITWMENLQHEMPQILRDGFEQVRANSILLDYSPVTIIRQSINSLSRILDEWQQECNFISEEFAQLLANNVNNNDPYYRKVEIDLKRHEGEFLLKYLIAGGFLPGYGFPVGIATFNPYSIFHYSNQNHQNNTDDDDGESSPNRAKRLPSRNLAIALSEYAPGSEIVLNGRVYVSNGISLTGQIDAAAAIQPIKWAWRCQNCGNTGTYGLESITNCPSCNAGIINNQPQNHFRFLQPSGFATDFYDEQSVTNNINNLPQIPYKEPWITANSELRPLMDPRLGYFKTDTRGQILYHNAGHFGTGFAICLSCGRAESMDQTGNPPGWYDDHRRLRGGRGNGNCAGTPQLNLNLGYEAKTDVFELYLKNPATGQFLFANEQEREINKKICSTLSVALRDSLARLLGVNSEEIGCTVKEIRIQENPDPVFGICLFDTNGGGSGFSSTAFMYLKEMFDLAQKALHCSANCRCACENCLISFDTKYISQLLDRQLALQFLSQGFLNLVNLPAELQLLGPSSKYCPLDFRTEFAYEVQRNSEQLTLFFAGQPNDLDLSFGRLKGYFHNQWSAIKEIRLVFESSTTSALNPEQKLLLYNGVAGENRVSVLSADFQKLGCSGRILAVLKNTSGYVSFATNNQEANGFNEKWGVIDDFTLVKSNQFLVDDKALNKINKESLNSGLGFNSLEITISDDLNGIGTNFGNKFWKLFKDKANSQHEALQNLSISNITYSDRYLLNPFTIYLITSLINGLPREKLNGVAIEIMSAETDGNKAFLNRWLDKNWFPEENQCRADLAEMLLRKPEDFSFETIHKQIIEHSRKLTIRFTNGQNLVIRFDQGMGYWELKRGTPYFPFNEPVEMQVAWIERNRNSIQVDNRKEYFTYVNVSLS